MPYTQEPLLRRRTRLVTVAIGDADMRVGDDMISSDAPLGVFIAAF